MAKPVLPTQQKKIADWAKLRPRVTRKLLREVTRRIVDEFRPKEVILFGSYAGGSPDIHSDLDLLVVMDTRQPIAKRIENVARVARVPFLPMDVLVHTPAEVRQRLKKGNPFLLEVFSRGKVLYQRESR